MDHTLQRLQKLCIVFVSLIGSAAAPAQQCETVIYDDAEDFNEGYLINVDASTTKVLKVNAIPEPLPYLWVPKSGYGTLVRIKTTTGQILGEYWTAPGDFGKNPSRSTVDLFGNAFVGNRNEASYVDGLQMGSVVGVGIVIGGTPVSVGGQPGYLAPPFEYCTCIDRNNDGLIRTSTGLTNILPWSDTGNDWQGGGTSGEPALVEEAQDECILIYQRTHCTELRHVSVDERNNVWVGGRDDHTFDLLVICFNQSETLRRFG